MFKTLTRKLSSYQDLIIGLADLKMYIFCFQAVTIMSQSYSDQPICLVLLIQTVGQLILFWVILMKLDE